MTHDELLAHCDRVHYLPYNKQAIAAIAIATDFPRFLIAKHESDHAWMRENPDQDVLPNHTHDIPF